MEYLRSPAGLAGSSTSRNPATACCSSHSLAYRSLMPARSARSRDVAGPASASAVYSPSRSPV